MFENASRVPPGPTYVLFILYGPANLIGVHQEFAYIFVRDAGDRWRQRSLTTKKELTAIECAVGRCPNSVNLGLRR